MADCRVHHHDVVLVVRMEILHHLSDLLQREAHLVQGEDTATIHVVNIRPHSLQRNMGMAVVGNDLGNLVGILVSVAALVELRKR